VDHAPTPNDKFPLGDSYVAETRIWFRTRTEKSYDLLIFDFSMPMIDGAMLFFLIGKVYDNSERAQTVPPLLLVSGKPDEERA
jgi:hypothetical protein